MNVNVIGGDNKPINLGVNELDKNVEIILSKPPGYRMFTEVKWNDVEVGIEETFAKLRLNHLYGNETSTSVVEVNTQSGNKISLRNIRATEMKCNKRVHLVESSNLELETKCKNLKIELSKGFQSYNDKYRNEMYSNLTKTEKDGLKKVKASNKAKKTVVFQTDKSKKFSIENPESYKKDMEKYVEKD